MLELTAPVYASSVKRIVLEIDKQPAKPQGSLVGTACATADGPRIRCWPAVPVCVLKVDLQHESKESQERSDCERLTSMLSSHQEVGSDPQQSRSRNSQCC